MSKELDYEFNNFANLLHKDCMNLMECLKKQSEDNKPILYLGKHYEKVILPYEEYQKMCNRLESIDNAEPSEALEELELVENWIRDRELKSSNVIEPSLNIIEQALLKAQEPKQYLTWETLPFKKKSPECPRGIVRLNAKMGNTPLKVFCSYSKDGIHHYVEIYRVINDTLYIFMNLLDDENDEEYKLEPQLFNDLHLERVEE